jgi:type IV secretion system protein VirB5
MKNTTSGYGVNRQPVPLDTGYAQAAEAWDRRMGLAARNAKFWRATSLCLAATTVCLAAGLAYAASQRQVEVYVAEVDAQQARAIGVELAGQRYTPDANAKAYFVADLIRKSRSRILDPVAQNARLREVYAYLAGPAEARMNEYMAADPPTGTDGKPVAREIEIGTVLQQGEDTYQVRWTERTFAGGRLQETAEFTGLFTVTLTPPTDKRAILTNPLGLYITDVNWGRDFTGSGNANTTNAGLPDGGQ